MARWLIALLGVVPAAGMVGCASAPAEVPAEIDPRGVVLVAGDGSGGVGWSELVARAAGADVVLIGELHGHDVGLRAGAALFEDLLAAAPGAVLSMEFYERDQQVAVDDYLAGVIDAEAFGERAGRTASNDPAGHRAMVEAARAAQRPVIAANAPRRYVRRARVEGLAAVESLTPAQRSLFELPSDRSGTAYRARFFEQMRGMLAAHGGGDAPQEPGAFDAMVEPFFRAQLIWDETMADSIADAVGLGTPIVHVVGRFHVARGGEAGGSGLVDGLRDRLPQARVLIVTVVDAWSDRLRDEDAGLGDVVLYAGPGADPGADPGRR